MSNRTVRLKVERRRSPNWSAVLELLAATVVLIIGLIGDRIWALLALVFYATSAPRILFNFRFIKASKSPLSRD
jgi:hypothetical protein